MAQPGLWHAGYVDSISLVLCDAIMAQHTFNIPLCSVSCSVLCGCLGPRQFKVDPRKLTATISEDA